MIESAKALGAAAIDEVSGMRVKILKKLLEILPTSEEFGDLIGKVGELAILLALSALLIRPGGKQREGRRRR